MNEVTERLEIAMLPNLARVYLDMKGCGIEKATWKISSDQHRVKFFIETLMKKTFQICPDKRPGRYLKLEPGETFICFGGTRICKHWIEDVTASQYISFLSEIVADFPDYIRRRLDNICRNMLPFPEPL
jgi:hypothetical protein